MNSNHNSLLLNVSFWVYLCNRENLIKFAFSWIYTQNASFPHAGKGIAAAISQTAVTGFKILSLNTSYLENSSTDCDHIWYDGRTNCELPAFQIWTQSVHRFLTVTDITVFWLMVADRLTAIVCESTNNILKTLKNKCTVYMYVRKYVHLNFKWWESLPNIIY